MATHKQPKRLVQAGKRVTELAEFSVELWALHSPSDGEGRFTE